MAFVRGDGCHHRDEGKLQGSCTQSPYESAWLGVPIPVHTSSNEPPNSDRTAESLGWEGASMGNWGTLTAPTRRLRETSVTAFGHPSEHPG